MGNLTNESLVQMLIRNGYLKTPSVIAAFRAIDRKDFVPGDLAGYAYANEPLPIGYGQTISQPIVVAFMLELLQPKPGEKILDIGSGSGWVTTLLAYLTDPRAHLYTRKSSGANQEINRFSLSQKTHNSQNYNRKGVGAYGETEADQNSEETMPRAVPLVWAVERIPELRAMTEANVSKYGFIEKGIVKAVRADGSRGYPPGAPYDKIIAAASGKQIPAAWKDQVKAGGAIVAPVKESIVSLRKVSGGKFEKREYYGFAFVPLVSD